jgi:hypothetical protein
LTPLLVERKLALKARGDRPTPVAELFAAEGNEPLSAQTPAPAFGFARALDEAATLQG